MVLVYPLGDYVPYQTGNGSKMTVISTTTDESAADAIGPGLVEERLVLWYFLAALVYLFISLTGGLMMALQLVQWNPHHGQRIFLSRSLADGAHQRDCLRIHRQLLFSVPCTGPFLG